MRVVNTSRTFVLAAMFAVAGGCTAAGDSSGAGGRASGGAPGGASGTSGGATGGTTAGATGGTSGGATGAVPGGTGGTATGGTGGGATGGVPGGGTGGAGTETGGNAGSQSGGSGGGGNTGGTTAIGGAAGTRNPSDGGMTGSAVPSAGCGRMPTLKNNAYNTLGSRQYYLRLPANYDNQHPHRLILGLHGATNKATDVAPGFWGLYALANGSTIFVAPEASGGLWSAASDTTFVDDILKAVEADLCVDTSRVVLEGFSQGAAMAWTLACSRAGVFRAVVGHSGGGVTKPSSCKPIPYLGSGGVQENVTQTTQTDQFATWNGCMVATLPKAPTGGHVCTSYAGCPAANPVRWCNFDGPHTPSPNDSGKTTSWMPQEVWTFLGQF